MSFVAFILLTATQTPTQTPTVFEATTLEGKTVQGSLDRLTDKSLFLKTDSGGVEIGIESLLQVRSTRSPSTEALPGPIVVRLTDGARVLGKQVSIQKETVSLDGSVLGKLEWPVRTVSSVRFQEPTGKLAEAWDELRTRTVKQDMLVVQRGDVLDHLQGVVGDIDEKSVKFLLDGDLIPVPRERVFGIVFARPQADDGNSAIRLDLVGGQTIPLAQVSGDGEQLRGTTATGGLSIQLPLRYVRRLDFSRGKVRYLSDMEPRRHRFTPYFDDEASRQLFRYRRDSTMDGLPLRLGGKEYAKGLWIHSKTELSYRLAGEYRRFRALAGIDDAVRPRGHLRLVITGDGKVLFEGEFKGTDDPRPLDLDVSNVNELEILVDFAGELDIADHLDLAEARVTK